MPDAPSVPCFNRHDIDAIAPVLQSAAHESVRSLLETERQQWQQSAAQAAEEAKHRLQAAQAEWSTASVELHKKLDAAGDRAAELQAEVRHAAHC